jgi:hypothetical protein
MSGNQLALLVATDLSPPPAMTICRERKPEGAREYR